MNTFSVVLIIIVAIVTIISQVVRKRQMMSLLESSTKLNENFKLLFSKIEKKIESKEAGYKKNKVVADTPSAECSKLVTALFQKELKEHSVVDFNIKYKHSKADMYIASPYEIKQYIIEGGNYTLLQDKEPIWNHEEVFDV